MAIQSQLRVFETVCSSASAVPLGFLRSKPAFVERNRPLGTGKRGEGAPDLVTSPTKPAATNRSKGSCPRRPMSATSSELDWLVRTFEWKYRSRSASIRRALEEAEAALEADPHPPSEVEPLRVLPTADPPAEMCTSPPPYAACKTARPFSADARLSGYSNGADRAAPSTRSGLCKRRQASHQVVDHREDRKVHVGYATAFDSASDPDRGCGVSSSGEVVRQQSHCSSGISMTQSGDAGGGSDGRGDNNKTDEESDGTYHPPVEEALLRRKRRRRAMNDISSALFMSASAEGQAVPFLHSSATQVAKVSNDVCSALSALDLSSISSGSAGRWNHAELADPPLPRSIDATPSLVLEETRSEEHAAAFVGRMQLTGRMQRTHGDCEGGWDETLEVFKPQQSYRFDGKTGSHSNQDCHARYRMHVERERYGEQEAAHLNGAENGRRPQMEEEQDRELRSGRAVVPPVDGGSAWQGCPAGVNGLRTNLIFEAGEDGETTPSPLPSPPVPSRLAVRKDISPLSKSPTRMPQTATTIQQQKTYEGYDRLWSPSGPEQQELCGKVSHISAGVALRRSATVCPGDRWSIPHLRTERISPTSGGGGVPCEGNLPSPPRGRLRERHSGEQFSERRGEQSDIPATDCPLQSTANHFQQHFGRRRATLPVKLGRVDVIDGQLGPSTKDVCGVNTYDGRAQQSEKSTRAHQLASRSQSSDRDGKTTTFAGLAAQKRSCLGSLRLSGARDSTEHAEEQFSWPAEVGLQPRTATKTAIDNNARRTSFTTPPAKSVGLTPHESDVGLSIRHGMPAKPSPRFAFNADVQSAVGAAELSMCPGVTVPEDNGCNAGAQIISGESEVCDRASQPGEGWPDGRSSCQATSGEAQRVSVPSFVADSSAINLPPASVPPVVTVAPGSSTHDAARANETERADQMEDSGEEEEGGANIGNDCRIIDERVLKSATTTVQDGCSPCRTDYIAARLRDPNTVVVDELVPDLGVKKVNPEATIAKREEEVGGPCRRAEIGGVLEGEAGEGNRTNDVLGRQRENSRDAARLSTANAVEGCSTGPGSPWRQGDAAAAAMGVLQRWLSRVMVGRERCGRRAVIEAAERGGSAVAHEAGDVQIIENENIYSAGLGLPATAPLIAKPQDRDDAALGARKQDTTGEALSVESLFSCRATNNQYAKGLSPALRPDFLSNKLASACLDGLAPTTGTGVTGRGHSVDGMNRSGREDPTTSVRELGNNVKLFQLGSRAKLDTLHDDQQDDCDIRSDCPFSSSAVNVQHAPPGVSCPVSFSWMKPYPMAVSAGAALPLQSPPTTRVYLTVPEGGSGCRGMPASGGGETDRQQQYGGAPVGLEVRLPGSRQKESSPSSRQQPERCLKTSAPSIPGRRAAAENREFAPLLRHGRRGVISSEELGHSSDPVVPTVSFTKKQEKDRTCIAMSADQSLRCEEGSASRNNVPPSVSPIKNGRNCDRRAAVGANGGEEVDRRVRCALRMRSNPGALSTGIPPVLSADEDTARALLAGAVAKRDSAVVGFRNPLLDAWEVGNSLLVVPSVTIGSSRGGWVLPGR